MAYTATATGSRTYGDQNFFDIQLNQVDLLAGTPQDIPVPVGNAAYPGWITSLRAVVQVATGAAIGSLTVTNVTTGQSATVTAIPASSTKGTQVFTDFTTPGTDATPPSNGLAVKVGDRVTVTPSGFITAGALNFLLGFNS